MLNIDGKTYNLRYDLGTIDLIEGTLNGRSLLSILRDTQGGEFFTLAVMRALVAFSLVDDQGQKVPPENAAELFDKAVQSLGAIPMQELIVVALVRDLGFLFRLD